VGRPKPRAARQGTRQARQALPKERLGRHSRWSKVRSLFNIPVCLCVAILLLVFRNSLVLSELDICAKIGLPGG
jgi:hypothetical protein